MPPYVQVLQTYMDALGRSDYATITALFASDGKVRSPFLGELPAGAFFERLSQASTNNVITPIDIFLSESESAQAVAYFRYDWTVRDATVITFCVMDHFSFNPAAEVSYLDLIYDTHPIRLVHGNKYESTL